MSEERVISTFLRPFGVSAAPHGPGDDCAVVPASGGSLCVTTDALVEGVHFTRAHFRWEHVGHKALAVNLSDLAAMGAQPRWFVCSVAAPPSLPLTAVAGMARGMARLARSAGIELVGGNFSRAREISLHLTCAGEVPVGRALRRDRARPGDRLYVSGTLGDARLGLVALRRGRRAGAAVARQRTPTPRVALGLLARRLARAGMDVSDGLALDLRRLCRASRVGARIDARRLPQSAAVRAHLNDPRARASFALAGGEDYELLLAVSPSRAASFERAAVRAGERVSEVGVVTSNPDLVFLWGERETLADPGGFDHFA